MQGIIERGENGDFRLDVVKDEHIVRSYRIVGSSIDKNVKMMVGRYDGNLEVGEEYKERVLATGTHREMYYKMLSIAADANTSMGVIDILNL